MTERELKAALDVWGFRTAKYARDCRAAQKRYFRTRDQLDLRECKALEKQLDKAVENYFAAYAGKPEAVQGELGI